MSDLKGHTEVKMGSDRAFGLVFAAVFLIVGLFPIFGGGEVRVWALVISLTFTIIAFVFPQILQPLNRLWFRFGLLLHRIVSPIVIGILFFLTVTPVSLIVRLRNPDLLKQKPDPRAETYWIDVDRELASRSSMRKQF
jgi:hypothetical protein